MTVPDALALGLQHHQSGRLAEADALYRQVLAADPRHADALHLLGLLAPPAAAVELILQAIALRPSAPSFHFNLGGVFHKLGRLEEAVEAYRRAIDLQPDVAGAHNNLGIALKDLGRLEEAASAHQRALQLDPRQPEAYQNLGAVLGELGRFEEAAAACTQAVQLGPGRAEAHHTLGIVLASHGQHEEAARAYREAVQLEPGHAAALNNLAESLRRLGHLEEAGAACRRALQLRPELAEVHNNLGNVLRDQGRFEEAVAAFRQALQLRPDLPEVHHNLGNVLKDRGQLEEAVAAYRRALELRPGMAKVLCSLGSACKELGRLEESLASFRQALALDPGNSVTHSNLLLALHYRPDPGGEILREAGRWAERHASPFIEPHANDRAPERRLRVGYTSADLREHAVATFLEGLLAAHDPAQVEIHCYSEALREDAVTQRLRAHTAHWRPIAGQPDDAVAALIRRDGIDLLVDLSGHTASHRLLVFARKPAPVQVAYLGYCGTTGLPAIDHRLTDEYADPPGLTEPLFTERLVRLPDCAWCYRPPEGAPPVCVREGPFTFGCFNALPKVTGEMLALWSRLLLAVPGARLLLKSAGACSPAVQRHIRASLANVGDRVEFLPWQNDGADHLAAYGRIDLALDTFPYHGTTTTCEALWMGVPVVTLAGPTHASRVGVSLLTNGGLPELIARNADEYIEIATRLAGDPARLAHGRATMRERLRASPLLDAPRLARHIEYAYRQMWRAWCAGQCSHPPA